MGRFAHPAGESNQQPFDESSLIMRSLLPLLLFSVLSAALAVVHNRALSRKSPSPVTRPVMAALAPGQRWVSHARESVTGLLPGARQKEALAESRKLSAEVEQLRAHAREV